jgi:hypothetical protein
MVGWLVDNELARTWEGSGSGLIGVLKKHEGEELRIASVSADILTRHVVLLPHHHPYRNQGIDSWVGQCTCSVCRRIPNVYGAYCATFVGGKENQNWVWISRSIYTFGCYAQLYTHTHTHTLAVIIVVVTCVENFMRFVTNNGLGLS